MQYGRRVSVLSTYLKLKIKYQQKTLKNEIKFYAQGYTTVRLKSLVHFL